MVIIYYFYSIQLRDNFFLKNMELCHYNLDNYIKNKGKIKINVN